MLPQLSYSNPAIEPLPVPPGPPDPPIPPGLQVEPAHRRLVRRRRTFAQWRSQVYSMLVLIGIFIGFPVYSIAEFCLFCFVPAIPATPDGVHGSRSGDTLAFYYSINGERHYDSETVSTRFKTGAVNRNDLAVHAIALGSFGFAKLDEPFLDFALARWWRWLISAFVLGFAILIWRYRRRMPTKLEETAEGLFAIHSVPMIARIIKNGQRSFTISSPSILYQYILPNGRAIKTTVSTMAAPVTARRRRGDPIFVLCNPNEPEQHLIYDELRFSMEVAHYHQE